MVLYWLHYLYLRVCLWITRANRKDRFVKLYNFGSRDPYRYGAIPSQQEIDYERPDGKLVGKEDIIEFFLQNSKGQYVFARISRVGNGLATVSFTVRVGEGPGKSWTSTTNGVAVDRTSSEAFSAGGLRIEPMQPMRRWRISFNGLVKPTTGDNAPVHLRAIFIGNFIHACGDYRSFHDEAFLAHQMVEAGTACAGTKINSLLSKLDVYAQTFSMSGKVFLGSEEIELFLWGYRRRQRLEIGKNSPVKMTARITGYTKNGLGVDLNEAAVDGVSPKFLFAHFNYTSLQQRSLEDCSVKSLVGVSKLRAGAEKYSNLELQLKSSVDEISWIDRVGGDWYRQQIRVVKIIYDSNIGHAVVINYNERLPIEIDAPRISPYVRQLGAPNKILSSQQHVLPFTNLACQNEELTGGKGSSLAVLTDIARNNPDMRFSVPQGVCVTTTAYRSFTSSPAARKAIAELTDFCGSEPSNEDLQKACEKTFAVVASSPLPEITMEEIRKELELIFGASTVTTRFAARSSACGEDSEDMSAAGQMTTILGVSGWSSLWRAIAECWASQFGFVAVQYKRRYGQVIDTPMCVVLQQMVASEVSGVMFTVEPLTADPTQLAITANFGLGESVVSATADPDTYTVSRNEDRLLKIKSVQLGAKKLSTFMKESGDGTEDKTMKDRSTERSLTDHQVLHLASVGVLLETEYASPRDTEWAFHKGKLFMLQARPVTSVDNIDTEFEYFHESDCGLVGEFDSFSKANVGEVFGGSLATATLTIFHSIFVNDRLEAQAKGFDYGSHPLTRHELFVHHHSQNFFTTFSPMGDMTKQDMISKGFSIAMSGRVVDDEIVITSNNNKRKYLCKNTRVPTLSQTFIRMWQCADAIEHSERVVNEYRSRVPNCGTVKEMLLETLRSPDVMSTSGDAHVKAIVYGSLNNVALLAILAHTEGDWTNRVFADFAALVASCNDIVSVGVPQSLQKIAHVLLKEHGKEFVNLDSKVALNSLMNDDTQGAKLFRDFLKEHGHRCLHEFDLVTRTWGMEPVTVVKTLQSMVSTDSGKDEEVEHLSIDEIMDKMSIKLNWFKRFMLRFILQRVRRGIALRERGKSTLVKSNHNTRLNLRTVARRMVKEGRIPEEDLLFFLTPGEMVDLIDTRNPRLIVRAMNRMKNARKAAEDIYPEHVAEPPFIPINRKEIGEPPSGARSMKGTPVSKGRVVATARVITRLADAHLIQKGDVLITYATDIGWSPYFPLISGIVTELGGLISHGAVVAREYGLPSIVGCHGATQMFRSGEEVLLDGNLGLISTTHGEQNGN